MQEENNEKRSRRSTRHYVVNDLRAEILATHFGGVFSAVDIRETLEFEPVKKALGLLEWASKKRRPMKALRSKAKKDGLGHYRARPDKPAPAEEYRHYVAFMSRKEDESLRSRGCSLSREERDALTREFYAPSHRAGMGRISREAWEEILRDLQEEEDVA